MNSISVHLKRILSYVNGTSRFGINDFSNDNLELKGYIELGWVGSMNDCLIIFSHLDIDLYDGVARILFRSLMYLSTTREHIMYVVSLVSCFM